MSGVPMSQHCSSSNRARTRMKRRHGRQLLGCNAYALLLRTRTVVTSVVPEALHLRHWTLSGFPDFFRKHLRRRDSIAAHQWRWRQRHVVVSVEDVTSTLNRISRKYADAPGQIERAGVISLLAKLYADGTAFADNRPRDAETVSTVLKSRFLVF